MTIQKFIDREDVDFSIVYLTYDVLVYECLLQRSDWDDNERYAFSYDVGRNNTPTKALNRYLNIVRKKQSKFLKVKRKTIHEFKSSIDTLRYQGVI